MLPASIRAWLSEQLAPAYARHPDCALIIRTLLDEECAGGTPDDIEEDRDNPFDTDMHTGVMDDADRRDVTGAHEVDGKDEAKTEQGSMTIMMPDHDPTDVAFVGVNHSNCPWLRWSRPGYRTYLERIGWDTNRAKIWVLIRCLIFPHCTRSHSTTL